MRIYLQIGMNLWTAFGVGLGASIFIIGLPCLRTFLIWGYKEKEEIVKKDNKIVKKSLKESKDFNITCFVLIIIFQIGLLVCLFFSRTIYFYALRYSTNLDVWEILCIFASIVEITLFIWFIFLEIKVT